MNSVWYGIWEYQYRERIRRKRDGRPSLERRDEDHSGRDQQDHQIHCGDKPEERVFRRQYTKARCIRSIVESDRPLIGHHPSSH
ncbi:hypothetical protein D8S78_23710 [Natrialba swarupiae]|nr:hypothetical protein [Natrialba swarupiae]